jgi:hypothetical protein
MWSSFSVAATSGRRRQPVTDQTTHQAPHMTHADRFVILTAYQLPFFHTMNKIKEL